MVNLPIADASMRKIDPMTKPYEATDNSVNGKKKKKKSNNNNNKNRSDGPVLI